MVEAEDALSEANALNNNNAEVWAYLALVCMQVNSQGPFNPAKDVSAFLYSSVSMLGGGFQGGAQWKQVLNHSDAQA